MIEVRPFERRDRDQLARLVNAHVAAATPGGSIPVSTLLSDLERPLGEELIGPWVTELATLVAVERGRLLGAAHLRRYTSDAVASEWYRDSGEIRWLLCWPGQSDAGRVRNQRPAQDPVQKIVPGIRQHDHPWRDGAEVASRRIAKGGIGGDRFLNR